MQPRDAALGHHPSHNPEANNQRPKLICRKPQKSLRTFSSPVVSREVKRFRPSDKEGSISSSALKSKASSMPLAWARQARRLMSLFDIRLQIRTEPTSEFLCTPARCAWPSNESTSSKSSCGGQGIRFAACAASCVNRMLLDTSSFPLSPQLALLCTDFSCEADIMALQLCQTYVAPGRRTSFPKLSPPRNCRCRAVMPSQELSTHLSNLVAWHVL